MERKQTLTERILYWVAHEGDEEGSAVLEVIEAMPDANPGTIRAMMKRLRSRGDLEILGRMKTGKRGQPPKLYGVSPMGLQRLGEGLDG